MPTKPIAAQNSLPHLLHFRCKARHLVYVISQVHYPEQKTEAQREHNSSLNLDPGLGPGAKTQECLGLFLFLLVFL
jgi:hypothetical protein